MRTNPRKCNQNRITVMGKGNNKIKIYILYIARFGLFIRLGRANFLKLSIEIEDL